MIRRRIFVSGVVQGVGFRPFVYSLARACELTGSVRNHSAGVCIEIEGESAAQARFDQGLKTSLPPLALIDSLRVEELPLVYDPEFVILQSEHVSAASTPVSPDIATCPDCLRELADPQDRRYQYLFLNCTNCGPRFTIIRDLPYDRATTTMAGFTMCTACAAEYHDPLNRRFHAQPTACPECGPQLSFPIAHAKALLAQHAVVAVKGIGGFHLACDATSDRAVERLRQGKQRFEQPFALMARDLDAVREFAEVNDEEAQLLESRARPIVLLRRHQQSRISPLVAPGNNYLGVMLPYAPLHSLLLDEHPLVTTSANVSGQPIVRENDEAQERLQGLADAILTHNREIAVVCDDSVIRVFEGHEMPLRRSRGYAPLPVKLSHAVEESLAVGGELKSTFCLTKGDFAYLSQHIGDMGTLETQRAFETALTHMLRLFRVTPRRVVCDLHPGYLSTRWAREYALQHNIELVQVQHHHAHVASLITEAGLAPDETVIGVAFDGTGYGPDGAIWGGEFLLADCRRFQRLAHLRYTPLPGGDASIKHPCRAALSHLWSAGLDWSTDLPSVNEFSPVQQAILRQQLARNLNTVPTSSIGRLFDAVAALLGVRQTVSYEGQAAIELESLCREMPTQSDYRFDLEQSGDPVTLDPAPLLQAILQDLRQGKPVAHIAAEFHIAVAEMVVEVCTLIRQRTGTNRAALTGGVFQNIVLLRETVNRLRLSGFAVLTHHHVPANDGGLALGQAIIGAAARMPFIHSSNASTPAPVLVDTSNTAIPGRTD